MRTVLPASAGYLFATAAGSHLPSAVADADTKPKQSAAATAVAVAKADVLPDCLRSMSAFLVLRVVRRSRSAVARAVRRNSHAKLQQIDEVKSLRSLNRFKVMAQRLPAM